ncbi:MAG: gephyrin-like molybdotransferase Glp [Daejeonella sp.]|uniref:molybdopterin molybdotransferase MoeA n=1 Tax=Daejeonella sp. JGW-45 TaxID=3034148 RepID=UPI0023ECAB5A|nr:gephyrin-like molybdotransferase Glp [Daejeonella sp. JGW-45]
MGGEFISVSEAKNLIDKYTGLLNPVIVPLIDAGGHVLSEDVFSKTDVPPFNQSSMDGYALNYSHWKQFGKLDLKGEAAAGSRQLAPLEPGQAVRIFTGAPVPEGADTVVMQERTRVDAGKLIVEDENLAEGLNFRPKGIEIKAGALAMEAGSFLTPAALGYLAGVGVSEVSVYPKPSITVILTGNELQVPGEPLQYGQVYESNSFTLKAALIQTVAEIDFLVVEDTLLKLTAVLAYALEKSDVVLLTGGVSVGDYDFVIRAAEANGVDQVFHKIRQKPGKPLFFGKRDEKIVFGLPGNPASVLSCFYEYVLPCLGRMSKRETALESRKVPLNMALKKPAGLTQFLKGHYDGKTVSDLKAQESFRLSSFAKANCLIILEEYRTDYTENELVEIHMLPE